MKRAQEREHLIAVATELFNRLGCHAVGGDGVIAEAGIAKTTRYRHFESKGELTIAMLCLIDVHFREDMWQAVNRLAREPRQKLLASFDALEDWFKDKTFYGCPFTSAAGEYSERAMLLRLHRPGSAPRTRMLAKFARNICGNRDTLPTRDRDPKVKYSIASGLTIIPQMPSTEHR